MQSKYDRFVFEESICYADEQHECEVHAMFDGVVIVMKEHFLTPGGYQCGEQYCDIVK